MKSRGVGVMETYARGRYRRVRRKHRQHEQCVLHAPVDPDLVQQEQMDKQEEERAEMERQRLRRLMAEGIIKPEDLKEDSVLFKDADRSSKPTRSSSKRRKKKVEVKEWSSLKPSFTPPPKIPVSETGNKDSRPSTRGGSGVSRHGSRSPSESQMSRLQQNGTETPRNGEIEYDEGRERSRPHTAPESRGSPGATRKRVRSAAPRVAPKYKDPLVEQMRQEQTISGLYSIAEKLVITKIDNNHKSTKKTAHFAD